MGWYGNDGRWIDREVTNGGENVIRLPWHPSLQTECSNVAVEGHTAPCNQRYAALPNYPAAGQTQSLAQ
ncbi:hypothetical protein J6590_100344 [Homalodisca vitripennis]|nr:hypothetical protein J6590_100344 [Homalodisca vitripennis]